MVAYSQNGWSAIASSSSTNLVNFPWVLGKVRKGDVLTIFTHLAEWYNKEIEPIRKDWSWGYNYRVVRAGVSLSNHAAGMAVDFNAPRHPLGTSPYANFSEAQVSKIVAKMKSWGGVVRWGGTYSGRKDPMHFEVIGSAKQVAALAKALNGGSKPSKPSKPSQTGTYPAVAATVASRTACWNIMLGKAGYKGATTLRRQRWLKKLGYYHGLLDGKWGPMTCKAQQSFLKSKGHYKGLIDGKAGDMTRKGEVAYLNAQRQYIK